MRVVIGYSNTCSCTVKFTSKSSDIDDLTKIFVITISKTYRDWTELFCAEFVVCCVLKSPVELHRLACCRLPVVVVMLDVKGVRGCGVEAPPIRPWPLLGNGVLRGLGEGIGDTLEELCESECKEPVDW